MVAPLVKTSRPSGAQEEVLKSMVSRNFQRRFKRPAAAVVASALALGASFQAQAAQSADSAKAANRSRLSEMLFSENGKSDLPEGHRLSLGVGAVSYFYSNRPQKDSVFPSFSARWKGIERGPVLEVSGKVNSLLILAPGRSNWYIEAPEAYVGTRRSLGPVQVQVGRKIERWSGLDETWQLGLFQPRFRWDYMRPEQVGLTGAFLSLDAPKFRFTAFGTPFFIPERGVNISIQNGSVVSQSPWFLPPPSKITIVDRATPVQYTVQVPQIQDIVMHAGAGGMLRVGGETGPWASASYAYKPMNQLLLAYDGNLIHDDVSAPVAEATVYPRVVYHHIGSLDLGYAHRNFSAGISGLYDVPVRDVTPERWTTQEVSRARGLNGTMDVRVGGAPAAPTRLELSYLRVWGGNAPDGGAFAKGTGSVFDSRYPFQNAMSVGVRGGIPSLSGSFARSVSGSAKLITDLKNSGNILSAELRLGIQQRWTCAFGFDVLGSTSPVDSSTAGSDFIGRYRSNDRIHTWVSYAL